MEDGDEQLFIPIRNLLKDYANIEELTGGV